MKVNKLLSEREANELAPSDSVAPSPSNAIVLSRFLCLRVLVPFWGLCVCGGGVQRSLKIVIWIQSCAGEFSRNAIQNVKYQKRVAGYQNRNHTSV